MTFELAPMSTSIRRLTLLLLALPIAFLGMSLLGVHVLAIPAFVVVVLYAWVWLRFRPMRFVVFQRGMKVIWPLKTREVSAAQVSGAKVIDRKELKNEIGWGMRVGAGGLWGAFGLLRTQRRGYVRMFISRTDRFVWIEVNDGKPWLITPVRPEEFVNALLHE